MDIKYIKKFNIIKKLIKKNYCEDIYFKENEETGYYEIVVNDKIITYLPENLWKDVKRNIDKKIKGFNGDCDICYEKIINNISCAKCSNSVCHNCYIKIFKKGKGIITCPYCKYSYGEEMSDYFIDMGIKEIEYKLTI